LARRIFRAAFDQLALAAADQELAAILGDTRPRQRAITVVAGRVGDLDLGDDVGGHALLLS
jgi:hypothetical protein